MAADLGEKPDTVLRWRLRRRIPEHAWEQVIQRAALRGQLLTASQLLSFNAPMKRRGRVSHSESLGQ